MGAAVNFNHIEEIVLSEKSEPTVKLSQQETNIVQFLSNKQVEYYQNLVQFTKNPQTVKLKTVQKIISDIKKKFRDANKPLPFNCQIKSLMDNNQSTQENVVNDRPKMIAGDEKITFNDQVLTKVLRDFTGVPSSNFMSSKPELKKEISDTQASKSDFTIDKYKRRVLTKSGSFNLGDDDFEVFEYFFNNPNKLISLEELRDEVVFPKFGSKLPSKWFSSISRRINNIRRSVPEAKAKILTVKLENTTGYLLSK